MQINVLAFLIMLTSNNAIGQLTCNSSNTPKSKELYFNLSQRPVIATQPKFYFTNCNVNDSIKKLLLFRVRHWQWSKEEIDSYSTKKLNERRDYYVESVAKIIGKDDTAAYKKSTDSLMKFWQKYWSDEAIKEFQHVDANLILTIGRLNIKEAIPFLKDTALLDSIHYDKWAIELTLAKMGNNFFYNKILQEEKRIIPSPSANLFSEFHKSFNRMTFLGTQESFYQLNKWIDTSLLYRTNSGGSMGRISAEFIQYLKYGILNRDFIELINKVAIDEISNVDTLVAVKNWMINNKGKYLFNPEFCPF